MSEELKKEAREEINGCSFLREEGAAEHISQIVQHYIDKAVSAERKSCSDTCYNFCNCPTGIGTGSEHCTAHQIAKAIEKEDV